MTTNIKILISKWD